MRFCKHLTGLAAATASVLIGEGRPSLWSQQLRCCSVNEPHFKAENFLPPQIQRIAQRHTFLGHTWTDDYRSNLAAELSTWNAKYRLELRLTPCSAIAATAGWTTTAKASTSICKRKQNSSKSHARAPENCSRASSRNCTHSAPRRQ